jgi:hypothetical protein
MEPFLLRLDDRLEVDDTDFDSSTGLIFVRLDDDADIVEPDDFRNIFVKNRFGLDFGEAVSMA